MQYSAAIFMLFPIPFTPLKEYSKDEIRCIFTPKEKSRLVGILIKLREGMIMKRRCAMVLLMTLIFGLILPMGCASKAEETKAGLGNSNANITNMGMSVADGDWIYFLNAKEDGALYKMKKDGTEEARISKDKAVFLNFLDGYIYYCNGTEGSRIYRIKPDGTERNLVSDLPSLYLISDGPWLYSLDN